GHGHGHVTAAGRYRKQLTYVLLISLTVLVLEVVGALVSGSLALLADAGHLAADTAGIALALFAVWAAGRPATNRRTFGYQRAEILAAVVNAVVLFGIGALILYEAVSRLIEPPEVQPGVMVAFGLVATAGMGLSLWLLRRGQGESLNVRGAFLEVLSDLLGAAAVVIAAVIIAITGFTRADAIASLLIGLMILPRTWRLLREAVDVLLEAVPRGVDLDEVRDHLRRQRGVIDVHDLHAWTITSGVPVLSAHVTVDERVLADGGYGRLLDRLHHCLEGHFDVEHSTFQLEPSGHADHEGARHP
ncbi:MAG: cation diffusion facilitator family transporter, partial [Streptosporangiales bacterium]|nr:cation diffusion facilitator family transporter [Streptosporangiales bacterium]